MQNQMAPKVSNNDIAASASDRHRHKRRKIDPEVGLPVP